LGYELKATARLAAPIVLNQVGQMSMALVDTLVAGHIGTTALAGLGLAANFYWTFTGICVGCLLALDTYFSQAVGAKDEQGLARDLQQSIWSCLMVAFVAAVAIVGGHWLYLRFGAGTAARADFSAYLNTIIWSLPCIFLYFVLQRYWQARQRVLPFTVIILSANVLNFFACNALGRGLWGFPRLGVGGIALATVICRYLMLIAALAYTFHCAKSGALRLARVDWNIQRRIFRLGFPAAGHMALEISAFGIATLIVASLGAVALAAHHVCLMMASFTFMFPLGFASAAAVRVGYFVGALQPERARLAGWLCIGLSIGTMGLFAVGYLVFGSPLLGLFSVDPQVISLGKKILILVACFQIADGIQVSTTGALRGIGNTRAPFFANLIGHYFVGLVLGVWLCFGLKHGVLGLWSGLAVGLGTVAVLLMRAWVINTRHVKNLIPEVRRSRSDRPAK
jgi:MATE family multidrug resistance protein